MIDYEKHMFCNAVKQAIAQNPLWTSAVIAAVNRGVEEAVEKWQDDFSKMAGLLLLFYLNEKSELKISADDKARTIQYLSRYFKMDNLK